VNGETFQEHCSKLKLIVSEVDGIITEDLTSVSEIGFTVFKSFYRKDFEAINELKKTFTFVFLSSDNHVSYNLCRNKNIPFFWESQDKKRALAKIITKYGVSAEEIMYIGCSFSDLECINFIPFSVCPSDSVNVVLKSASHVLNSFGGGGVLCELYDILKPEILRRNK
jgi:3-deoxy-D-manno-octulosonate 8-phosphate phosphatase (KDO 8-P phosphatase)